MKTNRLLPLGALLLGLWPFALTPGCGGGSNENVPTAAASTAIPITTGRAQFTIAWPAVKATRLLPSAASSIQVVLKRGTVVIASRIVARPAAGLSTVTFENLPVDTLTVQAAAYPNADGSGVAQAYGTAIANVQPRDTVVFSLTLGSTIDHLELSRNPVLLSERSTQTLVATALTAGGSIVLTIPQQLVWSGSNAAFSVDNTGLVTGLAAGTGTLTVQDTESGKQASAPVEVFALPQPPDFPPTPPTPPTPTPAPPTPDPTPTPVPIAVSFSPDTVKVSVRKSVPLAAVVTGDGAKDVTWQVEEAGAASAVGTVDASGLYSAPIASGTFHVVATSVADPTKFARLTVQVVSGSAGGTIQ